MSEKSPEISVTPHEKILHFKIQSFFKNSPKSDLIESRFRKVGMTFSLKLISYIFLFFAHFQLKVNV